MQGVENSELVYAPARETTLFHRGACKADSGPEETTATRQRDIKIQEVAVRAHPGDASSSAVRSWELDGHGRAGRKLDRVVESLIPDVLFIPNEIEVLDRLHVSQHPQET